CHLLPRLHTRLRHTAAHRPAPVRGRALLRAARLVPVPHRAAAGRDPLGRLRAPPRARPGLAVPRRGRADRLLDGARRPAQRLPAERPRGPDPAHDRAARPAGQPHQRPAGPRREAAAERMGMPAPEMTATDTPATDTAAIGTAPAETRLVETRSFAPDPALAGTWNVGPGIHE